VLAGTVPAQDKVSIRSNFFSDNTGTSVQSPSVELWKNIAGDLLLKFRYMMDRVNIPPIRGVSATPLPTDGITGASRPVGSDDPANLAFTKQRNEMTTGIQLSRLKASYYYSDEIDWTAHMASTAYNFDFNKRNTNAAFGFSYGWDTIRPLGQDTVRTMKRYHINAAFTQLLSPSTIARIGFDGACIQGFQSNPYRTVFSGGEIVYENHPEDRKRAALFAKLNHYFTSKTTINVEYRYYRDDWELQSNTIGMYLYQYFSKNFLFRWRYRYYDQSAAGFYKPIYDGNEIYYTSDYKLEPFNAHLYGFKIEYKLKDLVKNGFFNFLSPSTFEAKYERYFSSNDFAADIFQFALVVNY
jgi:hypothetical protein